MPNQQSRNAVERPNWVDVSNLDQGTQDAILKMCGQNSTLNKSNLQMEHLTGLQPPNYIKPLPTQIVVAGKEVSSLSSETEQESASQKKQEPIREAEPVAWLKWRKSPEGIAEIQRREEKARSDYQGTTVDDTHTLIFILEIHTTAPEEKHHRIEKLLRRRLKAFPSYDLLREK